MFLALFWQPFSPRAPPDVLGTAIPRVQPMAASAENSQHCNPHTRQLCHTYKEQKCDRGLLFILPHSELHDRCQRTFPRHLEYFLSATERH